MSKKRFNRHNKKRNSALLYEFLIKHISKCLVNNNKKEALKAVNISKKYFSKGSALYSELRLYNVILNTNVKSENSANAILREVCVMASKADARKLDVEKSKLIKEINYTFKNANFYKHEIPDYKIYASLHSLLNESRNKKKVLSSIDKIKFEDSIKEFLIRGKSPKDTNKILATNANYNNAVYKFIVQKFHEKYDKRLNGNQKKFLTKYAISMISEEKSKFQSEIKEQVSQIKKGLSLVKDKKLFKDSETMKKINECKSKFTLDSLSEDISEENVFRILQYMELVDEIES